MVNQLKSKLEVLIEKIQVASWQEKLQASDQIVKDFGKHATDSLTGLLHEKDASVRNAAAITLREIGDNTAVKPLIEAIKAPANRDNRSTLVYALQTLDCKEHFLDIVELLLGNAEVRMSAMTIFVEQGFLISDEDLKVAGHLVNSSDSDPELVELIYERLSEFGS